MPDFQSLNIGNVVTYKRKRYRIVQKIYSPLVKAYNPTEARDERGRWVASPGSLDHLETWRTSLLERSDKLKEDLRRSRLVPREYRLAIEQLNQEWKQQQDATNAWLSRDYSESENMLTALGDKRDLLKASVARNLVWGKGASKSQIAKSLSQLPTTELRALDVGKIYTENTEFLTHPSNNTEDVLGLATSGKYTSQIQVADKYRLGANKEKVYANPDIAGVTFHEVGHIRDFQLGRPSSSIEKLVDDDASIMTKAERDYAKYYFSNPLERFAELYQTTLRPEMVIGTSFGMKPYDAKNIFRKSGQALKEILGIPND